MDEIVFFPDDGFEERHAARKAKVQARLKRQRRMQRIVFGSIALIIIAVISVIVIVNVKKSDNDAQNDPIGQEIVDISNDLDKDSETVEPEIDPEPVAPDYGYTDLYGNQFITDREALISFNMADYLFTSSADLKGMTTEDYYSEYGIVVNLDTKSVIASKDGYAKIYPASMTKILTVLTAKRYISDAELDNEICVTIDATDYSYSHGCSSAGFDAGEIVTVRDLFYGTILPSGAEAAYMLAIYVAGSQEAFVDLMNQTVYELGISETSHFSNVVGIYSDDNYTTCMDMAVIIAATQEDAFLKELMNTRSYTTTPTEVHEEGIVLSNLFLRRIEDKDIAGDVVAAKTGFVNQSGNCAASIMIADNGTTYICVSGKATSSWQAIYDHCVAYNYYALGNYSYVRGK